MIRVGLTGGIASGKSAAGQVFAELGCLVIDTDQLARDVVAVGTPGLQAVVDRFGPSVVAADGTLDRAALGQIVFSDDSARADLNGIIHPLVEAAQQAIESQVTDTYAIVVHMVPLLVEIDAVDDYDVVVVVDVDPEVQLARLMARNGLDETQARSRIAAQADRFERLRVADFIIRNDGTLEQLRERTAVVFAELRWMRDHGMGSRF